MDQPTHRLRSVVIALAAAAVAFTLVAVLPWHPEERIRRAAGLVLATLILWITEAAPLGITGLLIPVGAAFTGLLRWNEALAAWGDPILFLFLGAFLLARALDKSGAFEFLLRARWASRLHGSSGVSLALLVMVVSGAVSTLQSNTAVAAMMLPVVLVLARRVRAPALVLLALSYGATFGGMATPVGTPPNFIGYAKMKEMDPAVSFISWMKVGIPIWIGMMVLTTGLFGVGTLLARGRRGTAGGTVPASGEAPAPVSAAVAAPADCPAPETGGRRWAVAAFLATAAVWIGSGLVVSLTGPGDPVRAWVQRYLPESLPPIVFAGLLFIIPAGPRRRPILDRGDFCALDWDTLYLIAGGLCLGKLLQASGADGALAAAVGGLHVRSLWVMFGLGAATVLLSELTSNTATAALMVPIAGSLAPAVGLPPLQTTWLVTLCASLGFALPVSTPPNAIVYGTGLIPLRRMVGFGLLVDLLGVIWVITCVRLLA
jgi:sodium-dependent dicarboxylate transporter 2/3/5